MGLLVNGISVLNGKLSMPRVGRWTMDATLDTETAPTGRVTVTNDGGGLSLAGTVRRGGEFTQVGHANLVGGSGGLETEVSPVYYRSVTVKTPLTAMLAGIGERLSSLSDAGALGTFLPRWTIDRGPGGMALSRFADAAKSTWRVLDDGEIWLGTDAFPETQLAEEDYETLGVWPAQYRAVIGSEDVPYLLRPGQTFMGQHVAFVEYEISNGATTTTVYWEREAHSSHPVLGPLQSIIRDTMRDTRYHGLYPATVVSQRADDSLDVMFSDESGIPPMTDVPLSKFAPGISVKVAVGARVLVGFAGGNPAEPVAVMWTSGVTTAVPVKTCGRLDISSTVPGTLTIAYTPPGGVEQVTSVKLSLASFGPVAIVVPTGSGADLAGRIET